MDRSYVDLSIEFLVRSIKMKYYESVKNKSFVTEVHIADIHFGSIDPAKQYNILNEQFLQRIAQIDFDILSIDGDIFDKKIYG